MNFSITQTSESTNSDYNLTEINFNVRISDRERTFDEADNDINEMFISISETFRQKMDTNDKIRIVFYHDDFLESIDIPFVSKKNFTAKLLIDSFQNVIQSYKDSYTSSNNFKAKVQIQKIPTGRGRKGLGLKKKQKPYDKVIKLNNNIIQNATFCEIQKLCNRKNSVIQVENTDSLCLLRAVLIAIRYIQNAEDKVQYSKPNNSKLNNDVRNVCKKVSFPTSGSGIPEIINLELYFKEYCITVIDAYSPKQSKFIYRGLSNRFFIYLILTNSHYNVITSMPAFTDRSYYCNFCMVGWNDVDGHGCVNLCKCCKDFKCVEYYYDFENKDNLKCLKCNIIAKSQVCLQRHLDLLCDKRKLCEKCNSYTSKIHVCIDQHWCVKCKLVVDKSHKCFFPTTVKPDPDFEGLIVFDYEAISENGIHTPNLIIAEKICKNCYEKSLDQNCLQCQKICVDNNDVFCTWLFSQKNFLAIAHNAKG